MPSILGERRCQIYRFIALSTVIWLHFVYGNDNTEKKTKGTEIQIKDIVFIILSQPDEYHAHIAEDSKKYIENQLTDVEKKDWPDILLTHEDYVELPGTWTVFPLVQQLIDTQLTKDFAWVFICEEDTRVNVTGLLSLLRKLDSSQNIFLGRELRDQSTTIIHHFAFAENPSQFAYPDFRAGFVLSVSLLTLLHKRLETARVRADFSIDPKHEFAMFVWDEGNGTSLTHVKQFCSSDQSTNPDCITSQPVKFPQCGKPVSKGDIYVAVKTCKKFHESRIPIVKKTWGKEAEIIEYISEAADKSIPTIHLGIPNTERGHCGKTMAIIERFIDSPTLSPLSWLLIADDDTIINLDRLRALLACYNHRQPVALGERYGYGMVTGGGYDYITGGGGMVFSQPAVLLLAERCRCYTNDSPDDMTLGMCLKSIGIPVTHSRYFHQARPDDYSPDFLANQVPVSFHKHWNNDPYKVYADLIASREGSDENSEQEKVSVNSPQRQREDL